MHRVPVILGFFVFLQQSFALIKTTDASSIVTSVPDQLPKSDLGGTNAYELAHNGESHIHSGGIPLDEDFGQNNEFSQIPENIRTRAEAVTLTTITAGSKHFTIAIPGIMPSPVPTSAESLGMSASDRVSILFVNDHTVTMNERYHIDGFPLIIYVTKKYTEVMIGPDIKTLSQQSVLSSKSALKPKEEISSGNVAELISDPLQRSTPVHQLHRALHSVTEPSPRVSMATSQQILVPQPQPSLTSHLQSQSTSSRIVSKQLHNRQVGIENVNDPVSTIYVLNQRSSLVSHSLELGETVTLGSKSSATTLALSTNSQGSSFIVINSYTAVLGSETSTESVERATHSTSDDCVTPMTSYSSATTLRGTGQGPSGTGIRSGSPSPGHTTKWANSTMLHTTSRPNGTVHTPTIMTRTSVTTKGREPTGTSNGAPLKHAGNLPGLAAGMLVSWGLHSLCAYVSIYL